MRWIKEKLENCFVSNTDKFLADFDKRHPQKSASQEQEIQQYQALINKRDIKTDSHS
ncbi:MAG: hypothetical protein RLY40_1183 [Pseudomonadota bacterium]|jgi:hypothetical protein